MKARHMAALALLAGICIGAGTTRGKPLPVKSARAEMREEDAKELWGWGLHEDGLFHHRSVLFVGLQALLFAGVNAVSERSVFLRSILAIVGLIVAGLWLVATLRQYHGTTKKIRERLVAYGDKQPKNSFFQVYSEIASKRSKSCVPGLTVITGQIIPIVFILAWVSMLAHFYAFPDNPKTFPVNRGQSQTETLPGPR
jgi:hypothetical protein